MFAFKSRYSEHKASDSYACYLTLKSFPELRFVSRLGSTDSEYCSIAQVCGLGSIVRRIERGVVFQLVFKDKYDKSLAASLLHDRMTQTLSYEAPDLELMFAQNPPAPPLLIPMHAEGSDPRDVLRQVNKTLGLALDSSEVDYLVEAYSMTGPIARDPTDAELFMFAQVNSEHCRHKQFSASYTIDGAQKPYSLFDMIRNTHWKSPEYVSLESILP